MTMEMVEVGHELHAEAMKQRTFHLAWGGLPGDYPEAAKWGIEDTPPPGNSSVATATLTKGALNTADSIGQTGVLTIVSIVEGGTTYVQGTDYQLTNNTVDWSLGGSEPAVDATYTVTFRIYDESMTEILDEVGRRKPTQSEYVEEDEAGDIVCNGKKWSIVAYRTPYVYLNFKFDADDAPTGTIYQAAIFVGTTAKAEVPAGQYYLLPSEIEDAGDLYMIENIVPISRSNGKREVFEYVITF